MSETALGLNIGTRIEFPVKGQYDSEPDVLVLANQEADARLVASGAVLGSEAVAQGFGPAPI